MFYFSQHYYLPYPASDAPSKRVISLRGTSFIPSSDPRSNEIEFNLRVGIDAGTFAPNQSENICILISNKYATEHAGKLLNALNFNAEISVDQRNLVREFATRGTLKTLYGVVYICFNVSNLSSGYHVITLTASVESGIRYWYSWQIFIEG